MLSNAKYSKHAAKQSFLKDFKFRIWLYKLLWHENKAQIDIKYKIRLKDQHNNDI